MAFCFDDSLPLVFSDDWVFSSLEVLDLVVLSGFVVSAVDESGCVVLSWLAVVSLVTFSEAVILILSSVYVKFAFPEQAVLIKQAQIKTQLNTIVFIIFRICATINHHPFYFVEINYAKLSDWLIQISSHWLHLLIMIVIVFNKYIRQPILTYIL